MPTGYRINLANGQLDVGDDGQVSTSNFTTSQTIGAGSIDYTYVNLILTYSATANGTYYLGTDGSVYFVPSSGLSGNVQTIDVRTAPTFSVAMGTAGNDTNISGSTGSDIIYGGNNTTSTTGTGNDTINAGAGNDTVYARDGNDVVYGGAGNDTVYAETGNDVSYGGDGNDTLDMGAGTDTAYGGSGRDSIIGGAGTDTLYGGSGNDTIDGGTEADTIEGGEGNDSILGGDGNDVIHGDSAVAPASAGATEHLHWASQGASGTNVTSFTQDTGNMSVTFTQVNDGDLQAAQLNQNTQYVGSGEPFANNSGLILQGTGGSNISTSILTFAADAGTGLSDSVTNIGFRINDIDEGTWRDQIIIRAYDANGNLVTVNLTASGNETINGGTITAGNGNENPDQSNGSVYVSIPGPAVRIEIEFNNTGQNVSNVIWLTDIYYTTVPLAEGNDTIDGGAGDDVIYGEGGNDSLYGGDGSDTIYGGAGVDYIVYGQGNNLVYGGAGDDVIDDIAGSALVGASTIYGDAGNDTIWGSLSNDLIYGGADNDNINSDVGDDTVYGGAGNDALWGNTGNDTLYGGAGEDYLFGEGGNDVFNVTDGDNTDYIWGGENTGDNDVVNFTNSGSTAGVTVAMTGNEAGWYSFNGTATSGAFVEIEQVNTTAYNDLVDASAVTTGGINLNTGAGNDSVLGGAGADTIQLGTGTDRIDAGQGNDTIYLGSDANNDTVVFNDGDGADRIYDFAAPTANGDGTYTGTDRLDVSGLHDAQGNPVYTSDVVVSNDGSGNAVLTFPNGESIILMGVSPTTLSTPQALNAIGIPIVDGTVTGTAGADTINNSYTGDPDGDRVDNDDNILPGKGAKDDVINALGGNDTVYAGMGNDTVYGGSGSDTISGDAGNDVLFGGTESDTFIIGDGWGADTVTGGEGGESGNGDVVDGSYLTTDATVTFTGAETGTFVSGSNTVSFSQIEGISTGSGDDSVMGSSGSDSFATMAGADTVDGGAGNDFYSIGNYPSLTPDNDSDLVVFRDGGGADMVFGFSAPVLQGDGTYTAIDHLDVSGMHDAQGNPVNVHDVTVVDYGGHAQLVFPNGESIVLYGVSPATMTNFQALNAIGIPMSDGTIFGTSGNDIINSSYTGDPDGDVVDAGDALDGSDSDVILALGGDDTVYAGAANDTVYGGDGTDLILGGDGNDTLSGDLGNDTVRGDAGDDRLFGGDGNDLLLGGDGDDIVNGEAGNDTLRGNLGDDSLSGGDGNDIISGFDGNDTIQGDAGDDTIAGEVGDDSLLGGDGNDTIYGGDGNDAAFGGLGNDFVGGGTGNDLLYGGDGNDTIAAGSGTDIMHGDAGDDTFLISTSTVGVTSDSNLIYGGTNGVAGDTIDMSGSTVGFTLDLTSADSKSGIIVNGLTNDTFFEIENVILGSGNDTIVLADGSGADAVTAFSAPTANGDGTYTAIDQLDVSALHDAQGNPVNVHDVTVVDYGGHAQLVFPNGESIVLYGVSPATMTSFQALNAIGIPMSDGTITGTTGNDIIDTNYVGDPDGDRVDDNDNVIAGKGANDDIISAGAGADTILSGTGNDTVYGGSGTDSITGGAGNDVLYGGTESDTFFLNDGWGSDTVVGGEGGETGNGDVLHGENLTTDVTVTLTGAETGTFVSGGNTVNFSQIEGVSTGSGDDSFTGSAGSDSFATMAGADTVEGGAGNDYYVIGNYPSLTPDADSDLVIFSDGDGADMVLGFSAPVLQGDGTYTAIDHLDVSDLHDAQGNPVNVQDVTVVNYGGHAQLVFPNGESIVLYGVSPATMTDPKALAAIGIPSSDGTVSGTAGDDVIDGSYLGDPDGDRVDDNDAVLTGDTGNDDLVYAGAGNDSVAAGNGNDEVYGGTGNDVINGGAGNDTLLGESGDDRFVVTASHGNDTITGGETGETSGDVLDASGMTSGVNLTLTTPESGTLSSTGGTVTFSEIEEIRLTNYADSVTGSGSADSIDAGDGNDTIFANAGNDTIYGGTGNDTIYGGTGDDTIDGGAGADSLAGDAGNDLITFGGGDTGTGGSGDDQFILDPLDVTSGTITIDGGAGSETTGDILQLGTYADWSTLVKNDDGTGSFSGSIMLDNGTILNFSEIENIICFTPGTRIATPQGARPIETLRVGDMVVTRDHGLQPIRWIQQRTVPAIDKFAPIRIRPGVVTGLERDLLVSPQHRMLFQGYRSELLFGESEVLVSAKHLVDGLDVTEEHGGMVTYIHMMFDQHEVVYAEGAATESFHPGDVGLAAVSDAAREELFTLFPEMRAMPTSYGRTARRCLKKHEAKLLVP